MEEGATKENIKLNLEMELSSTVNGKFVNSKLADSSHVFSSFLNAALNISDINTLHV